MNPGRSVRLKNLGLVVLANLAYLLLDARVSWAEMRREGSWPPDDRELVSFSIAGLPRAEAIQRLADKAGWSVVVDSPAPGNVDVRVKEQPAGRVLELILGNGNYVAHREGSLISITPQAPEKATASPSVPIPTSPLPSAAPVATPTPQGRGRDRVVTASRIEIRADEVVHDLCIFGGSARVDGLVTGDASVFGGSLTLEPGARVMGDLATYGGSVHVKDGARVDGEVSSLGGSIRRDSKAKLDTARAVLESTEDQADLETADSDSVEAKSALRNAQPVEQDTKVRLRTSTVSNLLRTAANTVTRCALLFVFGVILWSLTGVRLATLQGEIVARPLRAFALGAVGVLAASALVVALCVTVVGIPLALAVLCFALFGAYAGVCAVLTAGGALLVRHKTTSPYAHLAVGCGLYLVVSSLPVVGGFVTMVVAAIGFGALVATRAAGFVPLHSRQPKS